ncbi:MAG: type II toxin-antitoxin system VapC family toxin [Candidatus Dormibacteria bacterium]
MSIDPPPPGTYVDSSVLVAVLAPDEEHHGAALAWIRQPVDGLVTSAVAEVELGRALARRDAPRELRAAARLLLDGCELIEVSAAIRARAIEVRPRLVRSLDAIHVATALVAGLREFATYDLRQRVAAEEMGLLAPQSGG